MGGSIAVSSEIGKGSEFCARIPLNYEIVDIEISQPCELITMKPKAITEFRTRILVVEDNEVNQLVSQAMLERLNCEVTLVNNGLEAINAYTDGLQHASDGWI